MALRVLRVKFFIMTTILEEIIKERIRQDGSINMGEYMALCLGHPEHGYYMTRDPFGQAGDFTTAPEISQMFGELIGAWLADSWTQMGCPHKFTLVECGPGRGTLMADALRATKGISGFHEAAQLHLLETSRILRQAQEEALAGYGASWHSDPESLASFSGDSPLLIIGNEFLDALPVRQFVRTDAGWNEKMIDLDINDTLRLYETKANNEGNRLIPTLLIPPKIGDQVEVSLEQQCFLTEIMNMMIKQGGNAIFIDYGFTHAVPGDTLQAVKDHRYCGVLDSPGEVDITAHVNFADIAKLGLEKKLTVHGPVSQGEFLNRLGIGVRAEKLSQHATEAQRVEIEGAVKRLTGQATKAGEMGALFKVIAFSASPDIELAGFV